MRTYQCSNRFIEMSTYAHTDIMQLCDKLAIEYTITTTLRYLESGTKYCAHCLGEQISVINSHKLSF